MIFGNKAKVCAAIALLFLSACSDPCADAGRVGRSYNEALIVAYRTGDLSPLERVAGEKEALKVRVLVDLKKSNRLVLESSLESFDVTKCEFPSPGVAIVNTAERWRYYDRHLDPGESPGPVFVSDMTMQYTLERSTEGLKVTGVRTLSNNYVEPEGK